MTYQKRNAVHVETAIYNAPVTKSMTNLHVQKNVEDERDGPQIFQPVRSPACPASAY